MILGGYTKIWERVKRLYVPTSVTCYEAGTGALPQLPSKWGTNVTEKIMTRMKQDFMDDDPKSVVQRYFKCSRQIAQRHSVTSFTNEADIHSKNSSVTLNSWDAHILSALRDGIQQYYIFNWPIPTRGRRLSAPQIF